MKLSTWIISYELNQKYETMPLIMGGERTIESVRLFSNEGTSNMSDRFIYLGSTEEYFMGENYANGVVLSSGRDVIFVPGAEVTEVFNDLIVAFDKYRQLEEDLQRASMTPKPFEAMMEVIHELFQCPMLFGQKDLHIFALTRQYEEAEVYPGWDEIKKYGTMPMDVIAKTKAPDMTKYPESIKTVAIPVSPEEHKNFAYQIRSNVYCKGQIWGHLYVYYKNREIPPAVLQLARYCADAYGAQLDRMAVKDHAEGYRQYRFLIEILDGQPAEMEKVANIRWQKGWKDEQNLRLYKLHFTTKRNNEIFFDYAYRNIEEAARDEIVFPYQESIIVIAPADEETENRILRNMKRTMTGGEYRCGISYPFNRLVGVKEAHFQANFVLTNPYIARETEESVLRYDDHAFPGLISYVQQNVNYRQFVMPELLQLHEIDLETGSEYYKTLFWLLVNNGHAANTAKQLFIHRNTLKYRMDKIEEIMHVDLQDNEMVAFLRFCYSLLLDDIPITAIRPVRKDPEEEEDNG